jgi:hypothetical protein
MADDLIERGKDAIASARAGAVLFDGRELLAAYELGKAEAAGEGWKLVPIEITEDMAAAMECQFSTEGQWEAALATAPLPPRSGEGEVQAQDSRQLFDLPHPLGAQDGPASSAPSHDVDRMREALRIADEALMTALDCVQEHEPADTTKARDAVGAAIRTVRQALLPRGEK